MALFTADIKRIHRALQDVQNGVFSPSKAPPAIRETAQLLPDIEHLAAELQARNSELEVQSITDPLTGLYNRRYFDMMLGHAFEQSSRRPASYLVVLDLDDFKEVNDNLGHPAGDAVLLEIGRFLRDGIRSSDMAARLGGDEFALLLNNMTADAVEDWLAQLLDTFDAGMRKPGKRALTRHCCTLSAGVAPVDVGLYASAKDAFVAADRAMYRAKQAKGRHSRLALATNDEGEDTATDPRSAVR
jgi:diguanylate cyclase (GGDEF)-like protein